MESNLDVPTIVAAIGSIAAAMATWKIIFGLVFPEKGNLDEAIKYFFKPNFVSMIDGEYKRDRQTSFMLSISILSGFAAGFIAYIIIIDFF